MEEKSGFPIENMQFSSPPPFFRSSFISDLFFPVNILKRKQKKIKIRTKKMFVLNFFVAVGLGPKPTGSRALVVNVFESGYRFWLYLTLQLNKFYDNFFCSDFDEKFFF